MGAQVKNVYIEIMLPNLFLSSRKTHSSLRPSRFIWCQKPPQLAHQ